MEIKEENFDLKLKEDRIKIVNLIISQIANSGRKFFNHNGKIELVFSVNGKLYMKNEYNKLDMCIDTKNGYPPKGWHHGGTLWALVKDFKDFINTGEKSNHNNGYGGLYCTHWGYTWDDMDCIQKVAKALGYL